MADTLHDSLNKLLVFAAFAPGRGAKYSDEYVCLSVCLSFSLPAPNFTRFCAFCLRRWLGPPPAVSRYIIYFRFCGWRRAIDGRNSNRILLNDEAQ